MRQFFTLVLVTLCIGVGYVQANDVRLKQA